MTNRIKIGRLTIIADRFPWQKRRGQVTLGDPKTEGPAAKYGWLGTSGMGRFGGGYNWMLGFEIGGSSIVINLLIGQIRINWWRA